MARIAIALLGPFQVRVDDQEVSTAFRTRKERALLAYLAVEARRRHPRESLGEMLWPERPEGYARTNLRQALVGVRRALGEAGAEAFQVSDEFIAYQPAGETWLDVKEFTAAWRKVQSHDHDQLERCAPCTQRLHAMVDLYRGEFLEDVQLPDAQAFPEWSMYHREQYFRLLLTALHNLTNTYRTQGDYEMAATAAWRYVSLAPLEEDAHRQIMNLLALTGRRSAALEQYHTCQSLLKEELGVEPAPETTALYERIKAGELVETFPAGVPTRPTNLPAPRTPFFGREAELTRLETCLAGSDHHLFKVIGMAGAGKTRLAAQAALRQLDHFPDGVWFVPLEGVRNRLELAATLAELLGLPSVESNAQLRSFYRALRPLRTLLLLDGFDHLVEETDFLVEIIQQAPQAKLLLTSRRRMFFHAACLVELAGLAMPGEELALEQAANTPALQLFLARAQHSRPGFAATQANLPDLVRICRLVGGLPLGLELAAARLREYSCAHLVVELQRGLDILQAVVEDVPERHHSLRAALQVSWESLPATEKALFRRLSVFAGEFTPEQALAQADAPRSGLVSLVNRSLLVSQRPGAFHFHPLVRHFALEKQAEERLPARPANTPFGDPATGLPPGSGWEGYLPGRDLYWDRLERLVARCERQQQQAAVGLLLLANLDQLVSECGRAAVESALLTVGQRLEKRLRKNDTLARFSYKRFALLVEAVNNPRDIAQVVAKLERVLEAPVEVEGKLCLVQAHLGISVFPWDGHSAELLLEHAELALGAAVREGEFYRVYSAGRQRHQS